MVKYPISKKSKKAFLRWCSKGDAEYQDTVSYALEALIPMIEKAGFKWVDTTPDGYGNPPFFVEMSRSTKQGYECITFNFNKYRKLKFAIAFTVSDPSANYARKIIGNLVPSKKEDFAQHWWGASFISLNKQNAFRNDVDKVARVLPQIIDFLTDSTLGENIWVSHY